MKTIVCLVLFLTITTRALLAQTKAPTAAIPSGIHIRTTSETAEKLLIHKEPLACPHCEMCARIMATVVVAVDIDEDGNVVFAKTVSGPQMLLKPALKAVRKYKYKPYLVNGKAVASETAVKVVIDTARDCPYN